MNNYEIKINQKVNIIIDKAEVKRKLLIEIKVKSNNNLKKLKKNKLLRINEFYLNIFSYIISILYNK